MTLAGAPGGPRVLLIGPHNKAGLARDVVILLEAIQASGFSVTTAAPEDIGRLSSIRARLGLGGGPHFDLAIHAEQVSKRWLPFSRRHALLANPEWLRPGNPLLKKVDVVLGKTPSTTDLLGSAHRRALHLGFTSLDRRIDGVQSDPSKFLHIAGKSPYKGTGAVIAAWSRHPEWPMLTIVAWSEQIPLPAELPANVRVTGFLADLELQHLQASAGVHLCPSAAEGFGHTLVEGLSTGAVVITTDAPPMNEIVTSERGILLPWSDSRPMGMTQRYRVDFAQIEKAVTGILNQPSSRTREMSRAARTWYETNDFAFRERVREIVGSLL